MAEIVGSALLSAFFNVLFERLATQEVLSFLRPKKAINKLLRELRVLLWSADELLDDAEDKLIYNSRVENWHNELKDVVCKASELADKIETEALRRKLEGHQSASNIAKMFTKLCSNPLISFDNYVKDELVEILSSLEHLVSQKDALGLEPAGKSNYSGIKTRVSERFRLTPVADESGFCGREDIKETIMQSLRSDNVCDGKIAVVPIIGTGGIGKTTLAQVVYNHPDVKLQFGEFRAWVTVSTEFDLPTITKRIIGQVSHSSQIDGNVDQQVLLFKLNDALKGKKFLLVLDDVWSEDHDEWNNLKSCFNSGERGSKIVVTTRSINVASIAAPNQPHYFLPELSEEDCWRLFAKTVFISDQDRDAHPDLQDIGKKIVEKCKGLPLSVISVGGILCGDRDTEKWESILKSSVWELLQRNSKNIIPSLWLSYRYLPSHLKRCFAYCAIFPKDYQFQKEKLVQLWMAEGFLKNEAESSMEEVGKQYFEELISRSLFQRSNDDETIMMHDLVHDLAIYVSGKFCFWLDEEKILHDLACETRHFSYNLAIGDAKKFEGLSKAKRLHSFVGLQPSTYQAGDAENLDVLKVLEEFSMEGACLRVLSLSSSYKIDSFPDSLGKLKQLRYLNLSKTSFTKLPSSIGTLYNLQTLLLSRCRNLTRLPSNLGSLINLHHLDTRDSPLEEMPPKMSNLKKLHTLTDFVLGKRSGSSIKDLGVLQNLSGRIRISGLQNVNNVDDALKANLKNKKNLSELALEWEGQSEERDSRREEKVLEALQPHASLKKLIISEYGGTAFPHWIGDPLFSKIETVHLNNCKDGLFLPALGRLPSLKELKIQGFHRVETKDDGFYGNDSPFRLLKVLHFEDMPEWNCWSFIEYDKESAFPCLKELKLKGCPKLVGGLPNSSTITDLHIHQCENFDFPLNHPYPSLKSLSLKQSCVSLMSFPLDHFPKLDELELEELDHLVELTGDSANQLERLSIEKCPKLEFPRNRYESLKALKISNCDVVKSIPLDYFPKFNQFTLRDCQNFESFRFAEYPPLVLDFLTYLELQGLPKFVSFPEGGLPAPNLKDFYIYECKNLRSLPQHMHRLLPSLNILQVINCREIESWPEGGLPSNLESLDVWGCKKLNTEVMHWDMQTLTPRLRQFETSGSGKELLDSFPPEGLLPTSLTHLWIHNFPRLKTLNIHAFQHLKYLSIVNCDVLQFLPEESLPNSLSILEIRNCPLLERRYQKETGEGWHKISHISTVEINGREQHMS
ncbi:hypothetical protein UlMin_025364 [Ulmus minor]